LLEARRQAYLKGLGIIQYVSGRVGEPVPELPQLIADPAEEVPSRVNSEWVGVPQTRHLPVPGPDTAGDPDGRGATANPETVSGADTPPAIVRFGLGILIVPGQLMLAGELSDPSASCWSAQENRLTANLLRALRLDAGQDTDSAFFNWPIVNNPGFLQGPAHAHQAAQGFLTGTLERYPVPRLLVLGQTAAGYFLGSDTGEGLFSHASRNLKCLVTESIADMLQDWRQKPLVWEALAPLRLDLQE